MIKIEGPWNSVGLGNQFFMYSYLRLIAEELKYDLVSPEINFIEMGTPKELIKYKFEDLNFGSAGNLTQEIHIDDGFANLHGDVDGAISYFKNNPGNIRSFGYYQKYKYWKKYKNRVKNFFKNFISEEKKNDGDIAIHLRNSLVDKRFKIDEDYYVESVKSLGGGNVYLFAEDFTRHQSLIRKLAEFNPKIMDITVHDSVKEISKFDKLICSQGSFSFWVSFLSNATEIVWPVTKVGPNSLDSNWSIDYFVDDDSRYMFKYLD